VNREGSFGREAKRRIPWRRWVIGSYVAIGLLLSPIIVFHYELRPLAIRVLMVVMWPVELLIWTGVFGPV
jgi:hypothetical protein